MKVLHIVGEINGGGVGAVVYNYISHMNRIGMENDILVFSNEDIKEQLLERDFRELGCNIVFFPHRNKGYYKHFQEYNKLLRQRRYDIIHCHFEIWSAPYLAIARMMGIAVRIAHCHIAAPEYHGMKAAVLHMMRPLLFWGTTDRFACGNDAGKYLWKTKDFYVMRNAIDAAEFQFDERIREQKRSELNISENTILIGSVGRMSEQKNPCYIVDIAETLRNKNVNFKMLMIGTGELYEKVADMIAEKDLNDYVLMIGLRKDVNEWMHAMDVFVLPSRYEGLPVVAVEAQASGVVTLVSSNVTSEIRLLNSARLLPIDQGAEVWADCIINSERTYSGLDRKMCVAKVTDKGFEINTESEKLRNYYLARVSQK